MSKTLALALLTFGALGTAQAQTSMMGGNPTTPWYAGLSVGRSNLDINDVSSRLGPGTADEEDVGWKIYGGYRMTPNFAIEAGYMRLGKATFNVAAGTASADVKVHGLFADALGIIPLDRGFSVFGKLGLAYTRVKVNATGFGSQDENDVNFKFGLGGEYRFDPRFSARLEWERYQGMSGSAATGNIDGDLWSVGVRMLF